MCVCVCVCVKLVFYILHTVCAGQFTAVIEICSNKFRLIFTFYGHFYLYKAFFFPKSVHHLLSQILTSNQSIRVIRHLGCYQTNDISINKIHLCNAEETQKLPLKRRLDVGLFTHHLHLCTHYSNLQIQMHK